MLKGLELENFKAFEFSDRIRIAPITLIFGSNSAGKSSILQSLVLLKQTLEQTDGQDSLIPKGDLVDLGSFRDLTFKHDPAAKVSITPFVDLGTNTPLLPEPGELPEGVSDIAGLSCQFSYNPSQRVAVQSEIPVYLDDSPSPAFVVSLESPSETGQRGDSVRSTGVRVVRDHPYWKKIAKNFDSEATGKRVRSALTADLKTVTSKSRRDPRPELWQLRRLIDVQQIDSDQVERVLQRIEKLSFDEFIDTVEKLSTDQFFFVSRCLPSRDHWSTGFTEEGFNRYLLRFADTITNPIDEEELFKTIVSHAFAKSLPQPISQTESIGRAIRQCLKRMEYLGPIRDLPGRVQSVTGIAAKRVGKTGQFLSEVLYRRPELVKETNEVLHKEFDIKYSIAVNEMAGADDLFRLRLLDLWTETEVSLQDVGFGISQLLPVIVQSMLSQQQIILIEQPEVHIHPKHQAQLGSLLERCIQDPRSNQFIIETHSEHLIMRLQKLIRSEESKLTRDDVSILYVYRDEFGSHVRHMELDNRGDFVDEWPDGFFEEAYSERFG